MSNNQIRMLNLTAQSASLSSLKYRHSCGIFKGGKKIVEGHNHDRSTYRGKFMCSFHAEMDAYSNLMSVLFGGKEPRCLLRVT